ncbi:unnamed protein product [Phytophthora fragariaefolia]|uniref:Unnamed protein product n=1 Tax=Phytophthora fragariaefolia TaxID=1490495 RepID=A0A9W7CW98_9STRA|nr:unnamed protein product [Phytophthora fragariaefolia]
MSFDITGEFVSLAATYVAFEEEHRQAYWEATHTIPISLDLREVHPGLDQYYTARKQRRSRAGAPWKSFLRQVLKGMLAGHWDLDVLLDPFFLHYPQTGERISWYPGLGSSPRSSDLIEALRTADAADPCRNHYRDRAADHPAHQIDRLDGKFRPDPRQG